MSTPAAIGPHELPGVITAYLTAHRARDVEGALPCFTQDAEVVDDGRTHRGRDEIRHWLESAGSEYTYSTALVSASRTDSARYTAVNHLEGDFPGHVADLRYAFTLDADRITALHISP